MKIYNTTGSLSTVLRELHKKRIRDFKSLNDITEFQNSYILFRQRIILNHQELLEQEKSSLELALRLLPSQIEDQKVRKEQNLNADILSLKHKIQSLRDEIQSLSAEVGSLKVKNLKIKKYLVLTTACARRWYKETFFDIIISNSAARLSWQLKKKVKRYKNITSNYDKVLTKSYKSEIKKLESKKAALDELQPFILGAIGEERVVNCLVCLPDEYSLINDFRVRFSNPISSNNIEKVKSIQADHILIGPSGVFLIETKNWSRDSVQNPNLRSPIIQVRRTNYALYKMLHNKVPGYKLKMDKHHWGDKKIPLRSLVVMINSKPTGEFLFVKVLTLSELLSYIRCFQPVLSPAETNKITEFLLKKSDH